MACRHLRWTSRFAPMISEVLKVLGGEEQDHSRLLCPPYADYEQGYEWSKLIAPFLQYPSAVH
jgi:hypothetical protein